LTVVLVAAVGAVIVWWAVAEDPVSKGASPQSAAPAPAVSDEPARFEITGACEKAVLHRLKAPGSADFPGILDDVSEPTKQADGAYLWRSWVDAQNSYGAKIRNQFQCRFAKGIAIVRMDE
jgi:hypothetical protein